ncbi:MAG: hypothetical protein ACXWCF_07050, partial [Kaistella sp.]
DNDYLKIIIKSSDGNGCKVKVPPLLREDFIFSALKKEKLFLLRSFLSALFLRSSFLSFFSGFFLSCHDFLNLIG